MNPDGTSVDLAALPLDELRRERAELQRVDDVVSYVRRVAQARIDIVRAEATRRAPSPAGEVEEQVTHDTVSDTSQGAAHDPVGGVPHELRDVLSKHLTGGSARPPRPVDGIDDHPLVDELDAVAAEHGFSRLEHLDGAGLGALDAALTVFEQRVSADRRVRHEQLDALSSELVRRYRDGEASFDHLMDGAGS